MHDVIPCNFFLLYHLSQTVKWQMLQQESSGQEGEEVEDFGAAEHQKRELRKKWVPFPDNFDSDLRNVAVLFCIDNKLPIPCYFP